MSKFGSGRTQTARRISTGFGQRVYDLTVARRRPDGKAWSATDLANAVGVTASAARSYFAGTIPRGNNLRKLADVLRVSVEHLLTGNSPTDDVRSTAVPAIVAGKETPDAVMSSYQKWVAEYFVTDRPVPAVLATQWMARLWQAKSMDTLTPEGSLPVPFSPGLEEAAATVGPQGEILAVSDRLCEILGVRDEDVVGKLGCDFTASEDDADMLRQSLLSPTKSPTDIRMRTSSGKAVAVTAYPSGETGEAFQVTFLPHDPQGGMPTKEMPAILVTTLDGRIALVNDQLAGFYGMSREQIQGRNSWELVAPGAQPEAKHRIITGVSGPSKWPVRTADGRDVMMDAVTTIETINGKPMRVTRGWEADGRMTVERAALNRPVTQKSCDS